MQAKSNYNRPVGTKNTSLKTTPFIKKQTEAKIKSTPVTTKRSTKQKSTQPKVIQFNWRRHWAKKVVPHLQKEPVQFFLDMGMRLLDETWQNGDAPYRLGRAHRRKPVKGTLGWYQPLGRCHWIAFFAMVIGIINYPDLDWRFLTEDPHTVPVGYDETGSPKVVMDILLFERFTAEESIEHAQLKLTTGEMDEDSKQWVALYRCFEEKVIPILKRFARYDRSSSRTLPAEGN